MVTAIRIHEFARRKRSALKRERPGIAARPLHALVAPRYVCFQFRMASDLSQCLLKISNDIRDILDTHGKTHHIRPSSGSDLLLFGKLAVSGRGRVDDKAARVTNVGDMREQLHRGDKLA